MRATIVLCIIGFVNQASAQTPPLAHPVGGQTDSTAVVSSVQTAEIPSSWFNKAKGYDAALELQKKTGADIFIYFSRQSSDEAGLCKWFENKGLNQGDVRKFIRYYIKVQVPLPSNPDSEKLARSFEVRKCPAVFIVQPNGWKQYVKVFSWENNRPKLIEPPQLIESFKTRSSAWYTDPSTR